MVGRVKLMGPYEVVMLKHPKEDEERTWSKLDLQLDKELEDSFPASDPPKITRNRAATQQGQKTSSSTTILR
jgi:hypothetical protein